MPYRYLVFISEKGTISHCGPLFSATDLIIGAVESARSSSVYNTPATACMHGLFDCEHSNGCLSVSWFVMVRLNAVRVAWMRDSRVVQKGNSWSVSPTSYVSNYSTGVTQAQTQLPHLTSRIEQSSSIWICSIATVIGALSLSSHVIRLQWVCTQLRMRDKQKTAVC